ncbi:MAG TPA: hypothetical protein VHM91_15770 [Verrucomicrobiales bacterium]|jgi:hypothetical protein|nr:hypothetical protein [Verrucomicrobiales bacterium]
MKAWIRQRPWIIIVVAKALFVAWWVGFVIYVSRNVPPDPPTLSPSVHGRR